MTILDDAKDGMNTSIRPQDDLFGYVNGTWFDTAEIPADRSAWGPFVELSDLAEQRVREIIEDAASGKIGGDNGQKIGDLYASFMDEERVEKLGVEPIAGLLADAAKVADTSELLHFVGEVERLGGGGLFGSYVDTDDRDSDRYVLNILQGGLGLPDESYYRDEKFAEIRDAYVKHMTRMFALVGRDDAEQAARTVLDVETRLAAGHWERAETRDVLKTYNLTTVDELVSLAPNVDWAAWRDGLGAAEQVTAESVVRQPSYLSHLSTALGEVPIEQWREWLAARVIRRAAPYLPSAFVEENFDFYGRTLNGTPELRARWKRGVALVEGALGEAVGEEYVARHFPPSSKAKMDELVANLIEAYRRNIAALDWMTEPTKERAYEKLETFNPKIGYPKKFRDYSALEVRADDLMLNV
ncbi:MAG TPA: peptidase M13, partial [Nocardioidaceae bacterium]